MDLPVHDEILWYACVKASRRLRAKGLNNPWSDPRSAYPYLVRGSWMNDMNQVSPLVDKVNFKAVDPKQATAFFELWKLSLNELFDGLPRLPDSDDLQSLRDSIILADQNVDGFGRYEPFDHLDVVNNVPSAEYDPAWSSAERGGRAHTANFAVTSHIPTRLSTSTSGKDQDQRLEMQRLAILGRALHSVADFFSHSNYVELLLWSLHWRGKLDQGIVEALNHDDGRNDASGALLRCPLPGPADAGSRSTLLRNAVLWYGRSPEETPMVSSLFDPKDTLYSLLHIYAAHLVRTDGEDQSDEMLDLGMAIFDIHGNKLIKGGWQVLNAVSDVFSAIGQAARKHLANGLRDAANGRDSQTQDLMNVTAGLVERYDSKEAGQWAQAGRLSFLARELQMQMGRELLDQSTAHPRLPHHALIAKDHVSHEAGGELRFKLACMLATDVTAELIMWHFDPSSQPRLDGYRAIAARSMIHPWRILERAGDSEVGKIAERVRALDGSVRWQRLALEDKLHVLGEPA